MDNQPYIRCRNVYLAAQSEGSEEGCGDGWKQKIQRGRRVAGPNSNWQWLMRFGWVENTTLLLALRAAQIEHLTSILLSFSPRLVLNIGLTLFSWPAPLGLSNIPLSNPNYLCLFLHVKGTPKLVPAWRAPKPDGQTDSPHLNRSTQIGCPLPHKPNEVALRRLDNG